MGSCRDSCHDYRIRRGYDTIGRLQRRGYRDAKKREIGLQELAERVEHGEVMLSVLVGRSPGDSLIHRVAVHHYPPVGENMNVESEDTGRLKRA